MWTFCFCFTVICMTQTMTYPQYEITYSNNGWIPITINQVYKDHVIYNSDINTEENDFEIELESEEMIEDKVTTADHEIIAGNDDRCKQRDTKTCKTNVPENLHLELENGFTPNIFRLEELKNKTARRSKKILQDSYERNDETSTKEIEINEKSYEVTEQNVFEDLQSKHEPEEGYFYNQPNNYTINLLKLLSKYDIKLTDELPNYSLSLRHKAYNPEKQNLLLKPFGSRIPFRYNSLNHLPVDPLMAVFLSNYGYYLQGQYGIRNNYNNLYGYLASNNIHNNKPFGLYKVFADTDSSN